MSPWVIGATFFAGFFLGMGVSYWTIWSLLVLNHPDRIDRGGDQT